MKTNFDRKTGVWVDHSQAHFIDLSEGPAIVETVYSDKESQVRFKGETGGGTQLGNKRSTNSEHHTHNREQEIMQEYYHLLMDRLKNYDDIFLFGSTTAKDELYNHLKVDKHFSDKIINVRSADHLTENQMVAEVKKFFNV
jgi:peptide subunit release factor 1 (eRF1)